MFALYGRHFFNVAQNSVKGQQSLTRQDNFVEPSLSVTDTSSDADDSDSSSNASSGSSPSRSSGPSPSQRSHFFPQSRSCAVQRGKASASLPISTARTLPPHRLTSKAAAVLSSSAPKATTISNSSTKLLTSTVSLPKSNKVSSSLPVPTVVRSFSAPANLANSVQVFQQPMNDFETVAVVPTSIVILDNYVETPETPETQTKLLFNKFAARAANQDQNTVLKNAINALIVLLTNKVTPDQIVSGIFNLTPGYKTPEYEALRIAFQPAGDDRIPNFKEFSRSGRVFLIVLVILQSANSSLNRNKIVESIRSIFSNNAILPLNHTDSFEEDIAQAKKIVKKINGPVVKNSFFSELLTKISSLNSPSEDEEQIKSLIYFFAQTIPKACAIDKDFTNTFLVPCWITLCKNNPLIKKQLTELIEWHIKVEKEVYLNGPNKAAENQKKIIAGQLEDILQLLTDSDSNPAITLQFLQEQVQSKIRSI